MDLFKKITGKNPADFEHAAKILIDTPDVELFKQLVKQDDFLFDFVKENVAKRIQQACNKENYLNLMQFFKYYSPSYDTVIAEVLWKYGRLEILPLMKELFLTGNNNEKAYAAKFLSFVPNENLQEFISVIREAAHSDFEPLSANATEILSKMNDEVSKNEAIAKLSSSDEFEQYDAVKFLVSYGAKDTLKLIIDIMKKSTLSENIASEIPYLISVTELLNENFDDGILVLCNIINAIPEIIPLSGVLDYNIFETLENLYYYKLTSTSALLIRMAQEKFQSLAENEEYLFDCDKNTKDEIASINYFLSGINTNKLNSLIYEEMYDESDFVFFAVDYTEDIEELETLLDSKNQTLVLKVLTSLKERKALTNSHKEIAIENITNPEIKQIINVL